MTQKRWLLAGAFLALVGLIVGLQFWSRSAQKSIRPDQVTLNIKVSEPEAVISDVEIITAHAYTPAKVRTQFFMRIESSADGKTWRTIESRLSQGPKDTLVSEQKINSAAAIYYRATAYSLQNTERKVAESGVVTLKPIDIKPLIRNYYKASNAAWASSTASGLRFWADHSYPGLFDTENNGWTAAAAQYLADGYFESAKPQTIEITSLRGFVPPATGCEIAPPSEIAGRVFMLRVTVTTGYSKADIHHNPRTWGHKLALIDGKLYGFESPCR